jgi:hypothetical protein
VTLLPSVRPEKFLRRIGRQSTRVQFSIYFPALPLALPPRSFYSVQRRKPAACLGSFATVVHIIQPFKLFQNNRTIFVHTLPVDLDRNHVSQGTLNNGIFIEERRKHSYINHTLSAYISIFYFSPGLARFVAGSSFIASIPLAIRWVLAGDDLVTLAGPAKEDDEG